jgi:EmrB/QacA subfamily drug resistance transporter
LWIVALTSLSFFMVALDVLVVATALPSIQRDLRTSVSSLEWTVNAYTLALAAGIVTAAALGDRFGRRRVFVIGLAVFTVSSAACAQAPTAGALIAARTVQGLSAAAITPLALTILAGAFPPQRRGTVVGIFGGIAGLAIAGGPLIGGAVTQGIDWHWIFWVNVPIGAAAVILSILRLPESRGAATRLDLLGAALVTGAALGIAWGLIRANEIGWGSSETVTALIAGAVLLLGFVAWERRARAPMLPLGLFRIRAFAAANAAAFLGLGALFSAVFFMSQYFQFGLGYSPLATGLRFLPWTAAPLFIGPVAGALSDRIGQWPFMAGGLLLQAIGLGWIALVATTSVGYEQLFLPLLVAGVGVGMVFPTTLTAALSAVPAADIGKASGATQTLQRFGAVFAIAITGSVFAASGHLGSPTSFIAGVRPALAVAVGLSLLGSLSALAVGGRRRVAAAEIQPELPLSPQPYVSVDATGSADN